MTAGRLRSHPFRPAETRDEPETEALGVPSDADLVGLLDTELRRQAAADRRTRHWLRHQAEECGTIG